MTSGSQSSRQGGRSTSFGLSKRDASNRECFVCYDIGHYVRDYPQCVLGPIEHSSASALPYS